MKPENILLTMGGLSQFKRTSIISCVVNLLVGRAILADFGTFKEENMGELVWVVAGR